MPHDEDDIIIEEDNMSDERCDEILEDRAYVRWLEAGVVNAIEQLKVLDAEGRLDLFIADYEIFKAGGPLPDRNETRGILSTLVTLRQEALMSIFEDAYAKFEAERAETMPTYIGMRSWFEVSVILAMATIKTLDDEGRLDQFTAEYAKYQAGEPFTPSSDTQSVFQTLDTLKKQDLMSIFEDAYAKFEAERIAPHT